MNPRELAELCIMHGALQKQEEVQMLCEYLRGKPCKTVLEIGTARGGTLWLWHHLEGNETVISIDLPGGPFGGGPSEQDRERIENYLDPKQNTYMAAMDSHDPKTLEEVLECLKGEELDILFIDGSHDYEGVKRDYEIYGSLVKPGGVIIFHDTLEHPPETGCDVHRFWEELKVGKKYKEFYAEPKTWGGLSILEV